MKKILSSSPPSLPKISVGRSVGPSVGDAFNAKKKNTNKSLFFQPMKLRKEVTFSFDLRSSFPSCSSFICGSVDFSLFLFVSPSMSSHPLFKAYPGAFSFFFKACQIPSKSCKGFNHSLDLSTLLSKDRLPGPIPLNECDLVTY